MNAATGLASLTRGALVMSKHAEKIKILAYVLLAVAMFLSGRTFVVELRAAYDRAEQEREAIVHGSQVSGSSRSAFGQQYISSLILLVISSAGLAILIGRDVAAWAGHRVGDLVFNEDRKGITTPEYERAENEAAAGNYLEAIRLMRIHYAAHPNEVYVPLRIAEIYEVNLRNYLAAAMEYEEILKLPLPGDRWGWAAIHLVNLYAGKLNRADEGVALLQRIVDEHPNTAPARKARARLGIAEPEALEPRFVAEPLTEEIVPEEDGAERFEADNLPAGFRARTNRSAGHGVRPASDMIEILRDDDTPPKPPSLPPGFRPKV